jgi:hypothetical protein
MLGTPSSKSIICARVGDRPLASVVVPVLHLMMAQVSVLGRKQVSEGDVPLK